jgi:hypothetical protein
MIWRLLTSSVWDFIRPLLSQLLTEQGRMLVRLARDAVDLMEETELSGAEKREGAISMVRAALSEMGLHLRSHLVNAAIEAAVARLRGSAG